MRGNGPEIVYLPHGDLQREIAAQHIFVEFEFIDLHSNLYVEQCFCAYNYVAGQNHYFVTVAAHHNFLWSILANSKANALLNSGLFLN